MRKNFSSIDQLFFIKRWREKEKIMTVGDLIKKLKSYKPDAKVAVTAHNRYYNFTISTGGGSDRGVDDYDTVSFYVDELCGSDKGNNKPID